MRNLCKACREDEAWIVWRSSSLRIVRIFCVFICLSGCRRDEGPSEWVSSIASMDGLSNIAADGEGNVYALNGKTDTITKLNSVGSIIRIIGPSISARYSLEIKGSDHPIHVDSKGRIFIPSKGYLYILDAAGCLINVDRNGAVPDIYRIGNARWIGSDNGERIYIYPSFEQDSSLLSVVTLSGTHLAPVGDCIFAPGTVANNSFHFDIDSVGNMVVVFSHFAGMMTYDSIKMWKYIFNLELHTEFRDVVAKYCISLPEALRLLGEAKPVPACRITVFQDVRVIDWDTALCLSGDYHLIWYTRTGKLIRYIDLPQYMYKHRNVALINRIAIADNGRTIFGMAIGGNNIYRIKIKERSRQ